MARKAIDQNPQVYRRRYNFDLSHRVATTMKVGYLTPIDIVEVLPGDTWTVKPASLTRLSTTLVRPIMDDMYLDTYSFFVPLRILYDKLENVFGDSTPNAYVDPELAQIPTLSSISSESVKCIQGSVADYLGLPSTDAFSGLQDGLVGAISVLPFRAFALIKNEYFTVQSVENPVNVNLGEIALTEVLNGDAWSETNYTGMLPPVRRYGDYFSTCLPAPQKGPAVRIPGFDTNSPVSSLPSNSVETYPGAPLKFVSSTGLSGAYPQVLPLYAQINNGEAYFADTRGGAVQSVEGTLPYFAPANLWAQNGSVEDANIQSLRTAFQLQKYLERDALYGSRYREYLYAAYGVTSPDSRMQIPEFLAGAHNRLNIAQIPSTAQTDSYEVGQYAANINSLSQKTGGFSKSITEHGYIITVACIRYKHLYSQSVNRLWRRVNRDDFYDPLFANLGQQAVYVRDIFGIGEMGEPNQVLGYQEAYAEYRTIPDRVSAQMRPEPGNIGQYWSLADRFDTAPTLLDVTMEDNTSFERVISAQQQLVDPFVVDFNFQCSVARVVSAFGTPGLADHH